MSGAVVTMLRLRRVTSVTYVSVTPTGVFTLGLVAGVRRTLPPSPLGMWWRTARGETYAHEAVEQLLRAGQLREALKQGWFGDEWAYRLVCAAEGALPNHRLRVAVDVGAELGLDLRNEDGVATVGLISPVGAIARDGQLRSGDVVRAVDGVLCFTCEAVVRAIKGSRRGSGRLLVLEAVRPPVLHVFRDDALHLTAGSHRKMSFDTAVPSVLTYSWQAEPHAVGLGVVRLGGTERARRARNEIQTSLLDLNAASGRGHVVLPDAGRHALLWDNSKAVWTGARVRFVVRCVPLDAWEAGKHVERLAQLESECAARQARAKELGMQLSGLEQRLGELRRATASVEADAETAGKEKADNHARWLAATAERDELMESVQQRRASLGHPANPPAV